MTCLRHIRPIAQQMLHQPAHQQHMLTELHHLNLLAGRIHKLLHATQHPQHHARTMVTPSCRAYTNNQVTDKDKSDEARRQCNLLHSNKAIVCDFKHASTSHPQHHQHRHEQNALSQNLAKTGLACSTTPRTSANTHSTHHTTTPQQSQIIHTGPHKSCTQSPTTRTDGTKDNCSIRCW